MGVLGTNLSMKDATKTVIAEVVDKEDCYEIIRVYGNNEDFDVICAAPLRMPAQFCKKAVNHQLNTYFNDLPVYMCKISHNMNVMSKEEAYQNILTTTNLWNINE